MGVKDKAFFPLGEEDGGARRILTKKKNKLIGRSFVDRILVILLNFVTLEEMNHTKICTKKNVQSHKKYRKRGQSSIFNVTIHVRKIFKVSFILKRIYLEKYLKFYFFKMRK